MLLRSQLDCYHPDLPGSGVFDIKTRACFPIRYDSANYLVSFYTLFFCGEVAMLNIKHLGIRPTPSMISSRTEGTLDLTRGSKLIMLFQAVFMSPDFILGTMISCVQSC